MGASSRLPNWFGGTPVGVWTIKHLISPLDRWLYRRTGGRLVTPGHPHGPIVLLTTIGRRTGKEHTTPVFHSRTASGSSCAMSPHTGSGPTPGRSTCAPSPWPGSSSAARSEPTGPGRPHPSSSSATGPNCWGLAGDERFYRQGGRRSVFVLDPTSAVEPQPAEQLTP